MSEQLGKAVQKLYTQMESSVEHRMDLHAQLTAAQQRAERAEQEATKIRQREVALLMQWQEKVDAAQQRVTDNSRLTQDIKWLLESSANEFAEMEADNQRLRELLQMSMRHANQLLQCVQDNSDVCIETELQGLADRIKAAIGEGE